MKPIAYVIVLAFFITLGLVGATARSSYRDPVTGRTDELGSYQAVLTYTVDQSYGGWGISARSRPNLRGIAYADDLGPVRGAGLQMCSIDYHHSVCVWNVRIPFSRNTRSFRFVINEQVMFARDAAVNVTIELNNMFNLHVLEASGPFVRGGSFRYEASRTSLYLP